MKAHLSHKIMKKFKIILYLSFLFLLQGSGNNLPRDITTESGVKMIQVPGGWFIMGDKDEKSHRVDISSFCMDKYLVTQEEYEKVMRENPSRWQVGKNPVEQLTWAGVVKYCNARSRLEGLKPCYDTKTWECNFEANGYRLPTEAEWEYACRAGTNTRYFFGDAPKELKNFAWIKENSGGRPRPVGQKLPNPWGLYDMYGNVWEWCNDFYKIDYYQESSKKNPKGPKTGGEKVVRDGCCDPKGPETGEERVVRGGCWDSKPGECRSAYRHKEEPGYTDVCIAGYDVYGFRCVRRD